jgi:protein O-mannosyl-transferase
LRFRGILDCGCQHRDRANPIGSLSPMKDSLRIGLLLAVVALIYGNTLRNEFTMDDGIYILRNAQVTQASVQGLFAANKLTNVFRPVTFATLALNWRLGGARPFGFHLFNLILHACVTWLLFLLLDELLVASPQAKIVAFAAALIFAVHPLHTEAVASISGRAELLAAGFLFAAWILHLNDQQIPALICFVLALLSKESAVVFLPLLLVGDYARGKWKPILRYALFAGMTLLYLGILWKVQGGRFGQVTIAQLDNPLAVIPPQWRILNALRVAWKYAELHFYPAKLSCDYSFNTIPIYMDWRHTLPALLAAMAAIGAWTWAVWKRRSGLILAGGIYLGGFAVTANILIPTGTIMGERLAYLPSAGFCLLAALGWNWLRGRQRTLAIAAAAAIIAAFGMRTMVRNLDWKDNMSLYSAGVRVSPGSAKMHGNLGGEYQAAVQWDLAASEYETALRINPDYPDVLAAYGLLEAWRGHDQAGGQMLERAYYMSHRDNPNYDFMAVNYAALLMQGNHLDGALDVLNREIAESPSYARAWSNRAVIHYKQGQTAPARNDAEKALQLDPANTQAQNLLRALSSPGSPQAKK